MDRKQLTITSEDIDDVLMNDHSEFSLVESTNFGWIIKQVITNDFFEVKGYVEESGDIIILSKEAEQVFANKKECIVYE